MKISVALCTYNGEKYLAKQLNSIVNQIDAFVDEIIVCDDNSSDATVEILLQFQKKHPSVFKIINNETNIGSNKNFEKAISICTGDYIFLSDQDDVWKKDKVNKILAVFNQNPTAEVVFSNADLIDSDDKLLSHTTIWDSVFFIEKEMPKPIDFIDIISKNGNIITGATLCIKKQVKEYIFPFPTSILHDEWIACLVALRNTIAYSTENLISYRIHENQQVGMKNRTKLDKLNRKKRMILGIIPPKTYKDFRIVLKKYYSKITTLHFLENNTTTFGNLESLLQKSHYDYKKLNAEIKSKFPFQYAFSHLVDSFLGKRKLKKL